MYDKSSRGPILPRSHFDSDVTRRLSSLSATTKARTSPSSTTSRTVVRVRELRDRLGIAPYNPDAPREETISVDETAQRLKICVGSVHLLIREGILPAKQLMPSAPWQVPVSALQTDAVKIGVRKIVARRPSNFAVLQEEKTLKLPGF